MSNHTRSAGYSADVDLNLRVNGCAFPLTHVSRDRVILAQEAVLPAGPAEVIVTVDGEESRWPVEIKDRELPRQVVPIVMGKMA